MRTRRPAPHLLAGAYVTDALDASDRARFERHLSRCLECAREVSELREATARLAVAAAVRTPAGLREHVLAQVARTRQVAGVTGGRLAVGSSRARRARPVRLVAALAGVFLLAATATWLALRSGQLPARAPDAAIAAVLTSPDATMISAKVRTGGTATVVMSGREHLLVFAAADLRALPGARCYELWLMRPGGAGHDQPAALLPMPKHGMSGPVIASGVRSGDRLGLTVEPASGSRHPTGPMLLVIAL